MELVNNLLSQLEDELKSGNNIYIHCSAAIHRTGMITYALLRYLRYEPTRAKEILYELRPVTSEQVGEKRLLWGEQFFSLNYSCELKVLK